MTKFRLVLMVLLSLTLAGCGNSASKRLVGKWRCDMGKSANTAKDGKFDMASAILAGMAQSVEIELKADQTGTYSIMKLASFPLSWKVIEEQGDKITLEITNLDKKESARSSIVFRDNDHLQFSPADTNITLMEFERVKEK